MERDVLLAPAIGEQDQQTESAAVFDVKYAIEALIKFMCPIL